MKIINKKTITIEFTERETKLLLCLAGYNGSISDLISDQDSSTKREDINKFLINLYEILEVNKP